MSAASLSKPEEGSSTMSTEGLVISSFAMAVLFLSPPDMPEVEVMDPIFVFLQLSRPKAKMVSLTRVSFSLDEREFGSLKLAE